MPTKMHNDLARQNDDTSKNRTSTQGTPSKTKDHSNVTSKTAHKTSTKDEDMDNNTSSRSSRK